MLKQEINRFIRPIRVKLMYQQILSKSLLVLFVMSILMVLVAIASHITVILYIEWWMIGAGVAGIVLGIIWGMILYPKQGLVLKVTDQLGYDERLMTAWQLADEQSVEADLQRQDTLLAIRENDYRHKFKLQWQAKRMVQCMVLLVIAFAILFIESPTREAAKATQEMIDEIMTEEEKLTELAQEILDKEEIPEELEEQMAALLKELEEKLKEAKTEEDALKALSIAKDEIKKLDMEALKDQLAQLESQMKTMDKGLESGEKANSEEVKETIEALEEALELLEENGLEIEEAKALEEALEALKEAMESTDSETLAQALESASEVADGLMEALENAGSLSESMQAAINEAGKALSTNPTVSEMAFAASETNQANEATATQASEATSGSQSQGEGSESAARQGQGQGQSQSQGQGQGQGSGSGSGSGQGQGAGEGQGSGSSIEDSGYQDGESSGGGGWFQGEEKSEDYEALYPPDHVGGSSDPTFVQGNRSDGGDSEVQQVEGAPTLTGDLVSYKELYADYNDQAMHSVEDMDIPILMKDLVKAYFTSLDEE